jgi:hypothetical protein
MIGEVRASAAGGFSRSLLENWPDRAGLSAARLLHVESIDPAYRRD